MRLTAKSLTISRGQGLAEYSLIGFLILVVSIPAISLFGDEFMGVLGGIFTGMNKSVTAQATPLSQAVLTQSGDHLTESSFNGVETADVKVTLKDGTVITLNEYPQDLKKYVEATGSNGATTELLAQMDSLIAQLEKSKTTTSLQNNKLKELSNQGHRLASIEATIENAYKTAGSVSNLNTMKVSFENKQYSVNELSMWLGWQGGSSTGQSTPNDIKNTLTDSYAAPELSVFINRYFEAEASGALSDPSVRNIVSDLTSQIAYLTEVMEHASWQAAEVADDPKTLDSYQISAVTNNQSSQICKQGNNGNGKDNGVKCD